MLTQIDDAERISSNSFASLLSTIFIPLFSSVAWPRAFMAPYHTTLLSMRVVHNVALGNEKAPHVFLSVEFSLGNLLPIGLTKPFLLD